MGRERRWAKGREAERSPEGERAQPRERDAPRFEAAAAGADAQLVDFDTCSSFLPHTDYYSLPYYLRLTKSIVHSSTRIRLVEVHLPSK